jgi:glutathione S-transferase
LFCAVAVVLWILCIFRLRFAELVCKIHLSFLASHTHTLIHTHTHTHRYDTGMKKPNKRIDVLEKLLSKQEFLVEGGFSLADVAVASYLLYVPQFFQGTDLSRWPNLVLYMKRCAEREAYGKAFGSNVQSYLVAACEGMMAGKDFDEKKKLFGMF